MGALCRNGRMGLEESPIRFLSGTKVSSVIMEIKEEQKLHDLLLYAETMKK